MAFTVLTGTRIFAGGADLTSASNKCELSADVEDKDVTTFGSNGWKEMVGGLKGGEVAASGYWEAGDAGKVDDSSWGDLGRNTVPFSIGPTTATVGSLAYFMKAFKGSYKILGGVGDVAPWEASVKSNWPVVRGAFAHPPGTARTSDGNGTGVALVAVPAGSRLYSALHVLSVSGTATPTLTVTVESDVDNLFGDPTTVLTHTAATAISGEILRTDGTEITDTYYRVTWTITGTTPSFTFVSALGIA